MVSIKKQRRATFVDILVARAKIARTTEIIKCQQKSQGITFVYSPVFWK